MPHYPRISRIIFSNPIGPLSNFASQLGFVLGLFPKNKIVGIPILDAMVKYKKVYPNSQKFKICQKKNPSEKFVRKICNLKELQKLKEL